MAEEPKIKKWEVCKEHFIDLVIFFKIWFCYALNKGTGNKCEDRKFSTVLVGLVCLYLLSSGVVFNFGFLFKKDTKPALPATSDMPQSANLIQATTPKINITAPESTETLEQSKCDLNSGRWVRWNGKINQDFDDNTYFTLPINSNSVLFKYSGVIEDFSNCQFIFVPQGEKVMNYVISLDEIYQIVIGDNDYWTVTLRASESLGGELFPVKDFISQKTRPRLLNPVKKGTRVKVDMHQLFVSETEYKIELDVTYTPDTTQYTETQTETFSWTFYPTPKLLVEPELSIGLIRSQGDESEISLSFITPDIGKSNEKTIDSPIN